MRKESKVEGIQKDSPYSRVWLSSSFELELVRRKLRFIPIQMDRNRRNDFNVL